MSRGVEPFAALQVCLFSPDLPSEVALGDRHKSIAKAEVCYTCSPSVGLGGRVKVGSVFPRDGGQDPVSEAETE